jgi:uncharacterized protein YjiS (DUF1127 family)
MTSLANCCGPDLRDAWRDVFSALGAALVASVHAVMRIQERARERHALRSLGPEQLKDMGLTPGDVEHILQRTDYWR